MLPHLTDITHCHRKIYHTVSVTVFLEGLMFNNLWEIISINMCQQFYDSFNNLIQTKNSTYKGPFTLCVDVHISTCLFQSNSLKSIRTFTLCVDICMSAYSSCTNRTHGKQWQCSHWRQAATLHTDLLCNAWMTLELKGVFFLYCVDTSPIRCWKNAWGQVSTQHNWLYNPLNNQFYKHPHLFIHPTGHSDSSCKFV